ncbi:hypothetical protein MLD38_027724 [Melastoma candidum]|uniref:Uncharacterized protein n=1 Tax=Melastoma candidum TaxID=119954 RepID=A0ACB9P3N3_9MYRT|nr:hypothetical protein MLD38_027724 [Melastoma candidum]
MSEKGGKGFSASAAKPPKAPSFPPSASSSGLEDGSVKSKKRGRKPKKTPEVQAVRSDAEAVPSPQFGGKGDNLFSKGMLGKGVMGEKTASAPKAPSPKEPIPLVLNVESELPNNTKCLMDSEAAQILEVIQEQMVALSEDPAIKIPVSFDRGLQYSKTNNNYSDPSAVRSVIETLAAHGVSEGEMCVIANVCPETTDEVFALVPSLKGKKIALTKPLNQVLSEVAKLRNTV